MMVWLVMFEEDGDDYAPHVAASFSTKDKAEEWVESLVFRAKDHRLLNNGEECDECDLVRLMKLNQDTYKFHTMGGDPYSTNRSETFVVVPMLVDTPPEPFVKYDGINFDHKFVSRPITVAFDADDGRETVYLYQVWDGQGYHYTHMMYPDAGWSEIYNKAIEADRADMPRNWWDKVAEALFGEIWTGPGD